MEYKEIKKLIEDMGDSKLDSLNIEFPDGIKISMTKANNKAQEISTVIPASTPISVPVVMQENENSLTTVESQKEDNYKIIKSPMVGTFYSKSSPDKDPYVKCGDKISKGTVVCIIEAMKLMNEIESEFDGQIVEICVQDGQMVEYGKPLFKIK